MMGDETLQDVKERLVRIEVLLENITKNEDLKLKTIEERIKVANNRIDKLENSNTWLWRAIAGALIGAVVGLLI